ncbi:MAG: heme exporter protein CcmD [Pseudomonadota bacterium]|nr:heme exporter protein CcmD [Pseudomonadota bacterium]MDE3037656.1 heme exporter protein CcmD [Pseudomonadota bacterium]
MQKLTEVLAMGGYAAYVWPAYLAAAAVMLGLAVVTAQSLKRTRQALADLQQSSSQ